MLKSSVIFLNAILLLAAFTARFFLKDVSSAFHLHPIQWALAAYAGANIIWMICSFFERPPKVSLYLPTLWNCWLFSFALAIALVNPLIGDAMIAVAVISFIAILDSREKHFARISAKDSEYRQRVDWLHRHKGLCDVLFSSACYVAIIGYVFLHVCIKELAASNWHYITQGRITAAIMWHELVLSAVVTLAGAVSVGVCWHRRRELKKELLDYVNLNSHLRDKS